MTRAVEGSGEKLNGTLRRAQALAEGDARPLHSEMADAVAGAVIESTPAAAQQAPFDPARCAPFDPSKHTVQLVSPFPAWRAPGE